MALVYKSEVAIFERVWATNFLAKATQNGIGPFLKTIIIKVAFIQRQITRRKMVIYLLEKTFFIAQMAKSTANYTA